VFLSSGRRISEKKKSKEQAHDTCCIYGVHTVGKVYLYSFLVLILKYSFFPGGHTSAAAASSGALHCAQRVLRRPRRRG